MGVQLDGTLNGISILSISETAGLGMNATKDEFKNQFSDKNAEALRLQKQVHPLTMKLMQSVVLPLLQKQ